MRGKKKKNSNSPEELEELFRSSDTYHNAENIQAIFNGYSKEEKYYRAYAFALDYYELVEPFFSALKGGEDSNLLNDIFLVFCEEGDRERAIKVAVILIDDYTAPMPLSCSAIHTKLTALFRQISYTLYKWR